MAPWGLKTVMVHAIWFLLSNLNLTGVMYPYQTRDLSKKLKERSKKGGDSDVQEDSINVPQNRLYKEQTGEAPAVAGFLSFSW